MPTTLVFALLCAAMAGCSSSKPGFPTAGATAKVPADKFVQDPLDRPEDKPSQLPPRPVISEVTGKNAADITIQPDSIVQVSVAEDPSLDGSYPVNEIGAVELGYVGPVFLFNKTAREAAQKIKDVLKTRGQFVNATVTVRILRASYDNVLVTGAVNRPGMIRIGAGDSIQLNDALLRAGGLRPSARGVRVRVVRSGLLSAVAPSLEGEEYSLLSAEGKPSVPEVILRNNDIAFVFSGQVEAGGAAAEKEIVVLGSVGRSGVYRFAANEPCTMMYLIFKIGGLPAQANRKAVKIIRKDKDNNETEIKVNVSDVLEDGNPKYDTPLENGDRVVFPERRRSLF